LNGQLVADALNRVAQHRSLPRTITVDHGTEFTSKVLDEWAYQRGVELDFIRPGKHVENASIESFNGRLRDECLNVHAFVSIDDVRSRLDDWREDYNQVRPHGALGMLTPSEFAERGQRPACEVA
jgi:putative transposase